MAGKAEGLITAVQLAGGMGDLGLGEDEQADMFATVCEGPLSPAPKRKSGPQGGRPQGALNKSTEAWRAWFLSRYPSPLMGLGELYSRRPEDLARELGMMREVPVVPEGQTALKTLINDQGKQTFVVWDLERAYRLQMEAKATALPYVHQKQPIAVETTGNSAGMIVIGDIQGVTDGDKGELRVTVVRPQQNQGVIDAEIVQSHEPQSHDTDKPMNSQGE